MISVFLCNLESLAGTYTPAVWEFFHRQDLILNQNVIHKLSIYVGAGERRCIECLRHGGRRQREDGLQRRYIYVVGTIRTSNDDEGRNIKL